MCSWLCEADQVVVAAQVVDDWYRCGVMRYCGAVLQIRDRARERKIDVFVEDVSSEVLAECE
jgi:hypothetical protein